MVEERGKLDAKFTTSGEVLVGEARLELEVLIETALPEGGWSGDGGDSSPFSTISFTYESKRISR